MSNFKTHELVPHDIYRLLGENARNLISGRLIHAMDLMRIDLKKPMICNTKGRGGRDQSCLRVPGQSYWREGSQHSGNHDGSIDGNKCTASDTVGDWDVREAHAIILKNPEKYSMVRFVEIDVSWLHMDVRNDTSAFALWSPKRGFVSKATYIQELKENGFW